MGTKRAPGFVYGRTERKCEFRSSGLQTIQVFCLTRTFSRRDPIHDTYISDEGTQKLVPRYALLAPRNGALLEKLTGLPLVKKFLTFHGTRQFITALTSARHLSLSWTSLIRSIPPHRTSWRPIIILSTHLRLGLPSGLFPSGFPTKTLYTSLPSPVRATCSAHLILLDFIPAQYWLRNKEY